jgi:hypothetical protein
MSEYIVEYIVTQVRFARVNADSAQSAHDEVTSWHEQMDTNKVSETVIIRSVNEDK